MNATQQIGQLQFFLKAEILVAIKHFKKATSAFFLSWYFQVGRPIFMNHSRFFALKTIRFPYNLNIYTYCSIYCFYCIYNCLSVSYRLKLNVKRQEDYPILNYIQLYISFLVKFENNKNDNIYKSEAQEIRCSNKFWQLACRHIKYWRE